MVGVVEPEGIEPPSMHCKCIVLPLNHGPKGGLYRIRTRSGDADNVPCYHYTNKPVCLCVCVCAVELEGIEPPSMHCECIVLPLNYSLISELCVEPPPGIEPGTQAS